MLLLNIVSLLYITTLTCSCVRKTLYHVDVVVMLAWLGGVMGESVVVGKVLQF